MVCQSTGGDLPVLTARTVCVLDSDAAVRDSMQSYLRLLGESVQSFQSLAGFQTAWEQLDPCVIVCAAVLRDGHGVELFQWLQRFETPTPFALTLSQHDREHQRRARAAGIDHFLYKPLLSGSDLLSFLHSEQQTLI